MKKGRSVCSEALGEPSLAPLPNDWQFGCKLCIDGFEVRIGWSKYAERAQRRPIVDRHSALSCCEQIHIALSINAPHERIRRPCLG